MTRLAILERLELLRADLPVGVVPPSVSNFVPEDLDERPLVEYTVSGPYTPGTLAKIMAGGHRAAARNGRGRLGRVGDGRRGDRRLGDLRPGAAPPARRLARGARDRGARRARRSSALGLDQRGTMELPVTLRDQPAVMEDLGKLPVAGPGGRVFALRELADIRQEEDTRGRFNRFNGQTAVSMSVSRLAGSDAIKTTARIQRALAELQPSLPPGIRFRLQWDESEELAEAAARPGAPRRDRLPRGDAGARGAPAARRAASSWSWGAPRSRSPAPRSASTCSRFPPTCSRSPGSAWASVCWCRTGSSWSSGCGLCPTRRRHAPQAGRRILPAVAGSTLTTVVVLFPFLYLQGNARAAFVPFAAAFAIALGLVGGRLGGDDPRGRRGARDAHRALAPDCSDSTTAC